MHCRLSTGIWISQDLYEATRFPVFSTSIADWPVASHGGTLFLIRRNGRLFGISPRHIVGQGKQDQFNFRDILIYQRNREPRGSQLNYLAASHVAIPNEDEATGPDDAFDLLLWEFEDCEGDGAHAFVWDKNTIDRPAIGSTLWVVGYLKDATEIETWAVNTAASYVQPAKIQLRYQAKMSSDECSMVGISFGDPNEIWKLHQLTGLSGAPVFSVDQSKYCGMVLRGGVDLSNGMITVRFMAASFIDRMLNHFLSGSETFDFHVELYR